MRTRYLRAFTLIAAFAAAPVVANAQFIHPGLLHSRADLQRMRDGIDQHGPVREGVYAMTGYEGVDAHAAELGQESRAADGSGNQGS